MNGPREFALREATPDDDAAIEALSRASPDGGAIAFSLEVYVPTSEAEADRRDRVSVVAESGGEVVGSARLGLGRCRLAGRTVDYAMLSALTVHPAHRRRGIATALAGWRLERAVEISGPDVLILATIQDGNTASTANARRWATQIAGRMVVTPIPMRRRPPRPRPDLVVRPATDAEIEALAHEIGDSTERYDLAPAWDAERLRSWLAASPLPAPVNHYQVVTDRSGRLLGGMGLHEEGRLHAMVIHHMPVPVRLANKVLRVVPPDGRMRNVVVDKVWFAPGHLDAARYLWETSRWEWRERGSSLLSNHDPRSPVHDVVRAPRWLPATGATVALRSTRRISETPLIDLLL